MKCGKCGAQIYSSVWWIAQQQLGGNAAPPALQVCDHTPEYWPDELNQLAERVAIDFWEAFRANALGHWGSVPTWAELPDVDKRAYVNACRDLLLKEKVHP